MATGLGKFFAKRMAKGAAARGAGRGAGRTGARGRAADNLKRAAKSPSKLKKWTTGILGGSAVAGLLSSLFGGDDEQQGSEGVGKGSIGDEGKTTRGSAVGSSLVLIDFASMLDKKMVPVKKLQELDLPRDYTLDAEIINNDVLVHYNNYNNDLTIDNDTGEIVSSGEIAIPKGTMIEFSSNKIEGITNAVLRLGANLQDVNRQISLLNSRTTALEKAVKAADDRNRQTVLNYNRQRDEDELEKKNRGREIPFVSRGKERLKDAAKGGLAALVTGSAAAALGYFGTQLQNFLNDEGDDTIVDEAIGAGVVAGVGGYGAYKAYQGARALREATAATRAGQMLGMRTQQQLIDSSRDRPINERTRAEQRARNRRARELQRQRVANRRANQNFIRNTVERAQSGSRIAVRSAQSAAQLATRAAETARNVASRVPGLSGVTTEVAETASRTAMTEATESVSRTASRTAMTEIAQTASTIGSKAKAGASAGASAVRAALAKVIPKKVSAALGKSIPFAGWFIGGAVAITQIAKGDYAGAGLTGVSSLAGPATAIPAILLEVNREVYNELYGTEEDPFPYEGDLIKTPEIFAERQTEIKDLAIEMISDYMESNAEYPEDEESLRSAINKGIYDPDILGDSEVDFERISELTDPEIKAIIADDDIDDDTLEILKNELIKRKVSAEETAQPINNTTDPGMIPAPEFVDQLSVDQVADELSVEEPLSDDEEQQIISAIESGEYQRSEVNEKLLEKIETGESVVSATMQAAEFMTPEEREQLAVAFPKLRPTMEQSGLFAMEGSDGALTAEQLSRPEVLESWLTSAQHMTIEQRQELTKTYPALKPIFEERGLLPKSTIQSSEFLRQQITYLDDTSVAPQTGTTIPMSTSWFNPLSGETEYMGISAAREAAEQLGYQSYRISPVEDEYGDETGYYRVEPKDDGAESPVPISQSETMLDTTEMYDQGETRMAGEFGDGAYLVGDEILRVDRTGSSARNNIILLEDTRRRTPPPQPKDTPIGQMSISQSHSSSPTVSTRDSFVAGAKDLRG